MQQAGLCQPHAEQCPIGITSETERDGEGETERRRYIEKMVGVYSAAGVSVYTFGLVYTYKSGSLGGLRM